MIPKTPALIKRYVLVHYISDADYYTLLMANQGRHHFDDAQAALECADALRPSLKSKLGIEPEHVKVIVADCWAHGDCCGTVFSPEDVEKNKV